VLLPRDAADDGRLLDVAAPYRVDGSELVVAIRDRCPGTLTAALLTPTRSNSWHCWWQSTPFIYKGPTSLRFTLADGRVSIADSAIGTAPVPLPSRRFCWSFELVPRDGGACRARRTGHYVPGGGIVDDGYYGGDNYADYEAESVGIRAAIRDLVRRYPFRGVGLEIGCATGAVLAGLVSDGIEVVGIDNSTWAVEQARRRVGAERVWQLDVERDWANPILGSRAPFGALIMLSVFEHFVDPFAVLGHLSALVKSGGRLFLTTTNAEGIGRRMFGRDWEGYFDWTHHGVDFVSARSLREGLARWGWRVDELTTSMVWDRNADPTHATLREWWAYDARFRRLLLEREMGDLITCVATKEDGRTE
jgi:SAM-dependent methyltransferase